MFVGFPKARKVIYVIKKFMCGSLAYTSQLVDFPLKSTVKRT